MDSLLDVKELNIEFHDHLLPETVVYDFFLTLERGEIVGIVGESGSGKSMSALAIAGLLNRHDMKKKGQILFEGTDLLICPRQELRRIQGNDIGIVFQEPMTSLNPVKKIGWQIEESLRIHTEMDKEERRRKAIEALQSVELEDAERIYNMYPHELSGGMRQRAMIAAAIVCNPKILIADEPTTALDVTIQAQIVKLLKKINRENKTAILFISHDLSLVRQLCERVVVMQGGYIVETGSTEEIFSRPGQEYTKELIAAIPECSRQYDSMEESEKILTARNLNVSYKKNVGRIVGTERRRQILNNISFDIKKGEILGLVGESGCGKSTLAKALLGMVRTDSGEIIHDSGKPQMVFQDPYSSLNPAKKIGWILEEPLKLSGGMAKEQRILKVKEMLHRVGLDEQYMDRYPSQLSGGQRQRVAIAGALMLSPGFLIADEPVSALDVTIQAQITKLMLELHKEMGLSILFISHDLRVLYQLCDRVMIMQNGAIVEEGTVEEVYFSPKNEYTKELLESAGLQRK